MNQFKFVEKPSDVSGVGKQIDPPKSGEIVTPPKEQTQSPSLAKSLHLGMRGDQVKELQLALSNNGASCEIDGYFGPLTEAAVKHFQAGNDLVQDGVAGPITLKILGVSHITETAPPGGIDSLKPFTLPWYTEKYRILVYDRGFESQIAAATNRVAAGRDRYEAFVQKHFPNIPWYFVGVTHSMECSCNFRGVLHNGELIVGTGRKTTLVPSGRGPFSTWEDAGTDAFKIEGFDKITDWSIGNILRMGEKFNGVGYQKRGENTPYLWAMTSINDGTGKYVADNKYDENANANTQVGEAAIIKELELRGMVKT
jgi:lysozyme family protein